MFFRAFNDYLALQFTSIMCSLQNKILITTSTFLKLSKNNEKSAIFIYYDFSNFRCPCSLKETVTFLEAIFTVFPEYTIRTQTTLNSGFLLERIFVKQQSQWSYWSKHFYLFPGKLWIIQGIQGVPRNITVLRWLKSHL